MSQIMGQKKIDFEALYGFMERNYLKNRTIVSKDNFGLLEDIKALSKLPVYYHRYKTGEDHGTWIVPEQWDVQEAWIKDASGKIIASYDDHPLFVAPYSGNIDQTFTKDELEPHILFSQEQPDAYAYNYRFAYDPQKRLKDWGISIPKEVFDSLGSGKFHVFINTRIQQGEMLIGEVRLQGKSKETITFVADYCHPGQVNDSFSGLVMFLEVMNMLSHRENNHYTYNFLMLPETIGSAIYLASKSQGDLNILGSIFSDTVGWGEEWYFKSTRLGNTYFDLAAQACRLKYSGLKALSFMGPIGNDEYLFDSSQAKIPSLCLEKYPYDEYHTSNDNLDHLRLEDIEKACNIILYFVDILERDAVFEFVHNVPFHMSRYDLYADYVYDNEQYMKNRAIIDTIDGKTSILEIACQMNVCFEEVENYVLRMYKEGLVRKCTDQCIANFNLKQSWRRL